MRARRWGACPSVSSLTHEARRLGSTVARLKLKGIDGGPHKRWSMWFNSKQRAEPYQPLTSRSREPEMDPFSSAGPETGAAWLSSARVVRCWVKSRNERNSRSQLPAVRPGTLGGLPALSRRKVGTTSSHHGPYVQGDTRATMPGTTRRELARGSQSPKAGLSSDCRLQLDGMKPESLVIADQPCRGEYVPGACTHRPSRHGSRRDPKPVGQPQGGSRLRSSR